MYRWRDYNLLIDDVTAEKFATYMEKYPELYQNLAKIVRQNTPHQLDRPVVVDLGVGPGPLSLEIQRVMPEVSIMGLDPSIKMLKLARKRAFKADFKRFGVILSVAENIPLKSDSVDVLMSRFSLLYWKHPKDGFSEIFRVLKPGGKLILEALNADFPIWKLFLIKLHMRSNSAGQEVIRYHSNAYKSAYTMIQVEQLLTDSRFRLLAKEGNKKDWKFVIIAEKNRKIGKMMDFKI